MSASATPRKGNSVKQVDTDHEHWLYHRCIEDSVDIFADPKEDNTEERKKQLVINLGDLKVNERKSNRPVHTEASSSAEVHSRKLTPVSIHAPLLNVSEILRSCGSTYENFNVTMRNFNYEEDLENFENDARFSMTHIMGSSKQTIIDGTSYLNALNVAGVQQKEKTLVIVIAKVDDTILNVTVNSTIPCFPEKQSDGYWKWLMEKENKEVSSLYESIQNIISKLCENSRIIDILKLSANLNKEKKYFDSLLSTVEWEKGTKLSKFQFPNRLYHELWANSEELCRLGTKIKCDEQEKNSVCNSGLFSNRKCDFCNQKRQSFELFLMVSEKNDNKELLKCTECLKKEFFQKFEIQQFPIKLKIRISNEHDILPIFIPLPILNLYQEKIIRQSKNGMEKCPQCKTYLEFNDKAQSSTNFNVSCQCGYVWCQKCKNVPHWPMTCETFNIWEKKWFLKYSLMKATGTGSEYLLEVTCTCKKLIFYCLGPCNSIVTPCCQREIECEEYFEHWRCRRPDLPEECIHKLIKGMPDAKESIIEYYLGKEGVRIVSKTSQIPNIKTYVTALCKEARDLRFSLDFQRKFKKDLKLLFGQPQKLEELRKLMYTVLYLMENVTAWSNEIGFMDRSLKIQLEKMAETRKTLMEHIHEKKLNVIENDVEKLRESINSIIQLVNKKLAADREISMVNI